MSPDRRSPTPSRRGELALTRRSLLGGGVLLASGWLLATAWGHRPLAAEGDSPLLGASGQRTLASALDALLPEGAPAAQMAREIDAFLAGGDPVVGGQLALALGVLEHTGGAGLLRFRRFSRLDRDARTAVLEGWRTSRIGTRRQIADAVRRIALFSWYSRPDSWAAIGYDGPWVGR